MHSHSPDRLLFHNTHEKQVALFSGYVDPFTQRAVHWQKMLTLSQLLELRVKGPLELSIMFILNRDEDWTICITANTAMCIQYLSSSDVINHVLTIHASISLFWISLLFLKTLKSESFLFHFPIF